MTICWSVLVLVGVTSLVVAFAALRMRSWEDELEDYRGATWSGYPGCGWSSGARGQVADEGDRSDGV